MHLSKELVKVFSRQINELLTRLTCLVINGCSGRINQGVITNT